MKTEGRYKAKWLWLDGWSVKRIAKKYGVTVKTVKGWIGKDPDTLLTKKEWQQIGSSLL